MRVLVLYAHPFEASFVAALHRRVVDTLRSRGHEVDDCDLNVEGFDPVLSRQDRIDYNNTALNRVRVAPYIDRLLAAESLVLVFPVWNEGFPAILKGYFDRVFLPGVSVEMKADGSCSPSLRNVKKLAAVCTYGLDHLRTMFAGDPPRRVVKRMLRSLVSPHASCEYLGQYDMNHTTPERRASFLSKVKRAFEAW
jgi:putative NADPH-quinone reductase